MMAAKAKCGQRPGAQASADERRPRQTAGRAFRSCRTRHFRTWSFVTEGSSRSTQSLPR